MLMVISLFFTLLVRSQDFHLQDEKQKFSLDFQPTGNLVIVPVQINSSIPLNFVIDTGSPYTIITNLEAINYFKLNKGRPISISGLGQSTKRLEAYLSKNNTITLGKAVSNSTDIVLLFEQDFDLSTRFGIPIYGIIGYDILKDFVVEVNYMRKKISFYRHDYFYLKKTGKLKKFREIPVEIEKGKPYVTLNSEINGVNLDLRLLLDSGSWDAIWLFENKEKNILTPPVYINDYLGFGLNGEIHGKKTRITSLEIGPFEIKNPTTSFPDSLSVSNLHQTMRNGTIGSEIFRRFTTIYDYKNRKIFLKKNNKYNEEFHYNLAGLELYQPYPELPYLEVIYVRKDSPADLAGIKKGDAIRYVNGKKVSVFQTEVFDNRLSASKTDLIEVGGKKGETISLPEMLDLFKSNAGEKITVIYTRGSNETERSASFVLEKPI